jgi:hypothetical protein
MASERVRRTIAGAVNVGGMDLRRFVLERLVAESEDAREGATRVKALELIGTIPGVDVWRGKDERDETLADAGAMLGEVLAVVQDRLASEVIDIDTVHPGPNPDDVEDMGEDRTGSAAESEPSPPAGIVAIDPFAE